MLAVLVFRTAASSILPTLVLFLVLLLPIRFTFAMSLPFPLLTHLPLLSLLLLHNVQVILEVLLPVHGVHHTVAWIRLKLLFDVVPPGVALDVVTLSQHIQKVLADLEF